MNGVDCIILGIVFGACAFILYRSIRRHKRGETSCGCGCGKCSGNNAFCTKNSEEDK